MHLEIGDLKIIVKKKRVGGYPEESKPSSVALKKSIIAEKPATAARRQDDDRISVLPITETQRSEPDRTAFREEKAWHPVKAPLLGTFYRSPRPVAPPFVEVGRSVTENDTVCIIEMMKTMNHVKAGVRGRIAKICVENSQMVEYQQTLFLVEPESGFEDSVPEER
jgi:acetyl-CoA carboxylase biotin carboxyl carrier protein